MRCRKPAVIILSLLLAVAAFAPADKRTENIDMYVVLDRSLSMYTYVGGVKKIDAVKAYATSELIDGQLILGDFLEVIGFYGKTEILVSQLVQTEADRTAIKRIINGLVEDGHFTDIGNALDTLRTEVEKREGNGRLKHILLITDGIQEAPPTSKYYAPDGSFNHEFLANTKTIQKKGWKIQLIGLGAGTAVLDLARELEAAYGELTGAVSATEVARQTENLLGTIRIVDGTASVAPVGVDGTTVLTLSLHSEGYSREVTISVAGIAAASGTVSVAQALAGAPMSLRVAAAGDTVVRLPLALPADLPAGRRPWNLTFSFLPGERFTPGELTLPVAVKGWVGNHLLAFWLIMAGAAILAALIVLLVLRLVRGRPVRFAVAVDGEPARGSPASLVKGTTRLLSEVDGVFSLEGKRTSRSIARFSVPRRMEGRRALAMEFLKPDRFWKVSEPPQNALGASLTVKASDGSRHVLKISAKER
jgi:Mg-chelatase subunit ChlD